MCVVWKFQDEDSENSPLRKTAAHLSGRAARLSALPAARSCTPPLVPAAPCIRRALYPHSAPASALRPRRIPLFAPAVSRSPPAPVPRTRRPPPPSFDCRPPPCRSSPPPRARRASVGPRCRDFSGRRTPIPKQKRIFIPVLCAPGPPMAPARRPGPPTRPANGPGPPTRSGLCCCFRAEPSGGRPGPRRVPGRTPTSDP